MKKISFVILFFLTQALAGTAYAYWVWTPETGRWVNPKNAVKDSAKEQFEWAMHLYSAGDYDKAIKEFDKLVRHYPNSKYAPEAQYYAGRSHEDKKQYYNAFLSYQKALDSYPHIENRKEIIKREFNLAVLFYEGQKAEILGVALLPALDKAVEIFEKVVANDPYGEYADKAQFKIGESCNKDGRFSDAVAAFQKLIDEYPKSGLVEEAKYQVAYSTYMASLDSDYDQEMTDGAIQGFEEFMKQSQARPLTDDADGVLNTLRERKAKSIFDIAQFYEKQNHYSSAAVYYKEIVTKYADTSFAAEALSKNTEMEERAKETAQKKALKETRKLELRR